MTQGSNKSFINSIEKGMSVLSVIVNSRNIGGITQISKTLNLSIASVQRITNTFEKLGYLKKDETTQGFVLGHKAWGLGLSIVKDIDLKTVAHPYLKQLSHEIGETVNLAILDGTDIVYVDRIKTERIININLSIGSRLPLYCTSMGKCLLAFLPDADLSELLNKLEMKPFTSRTITDKGKLLEDLKKVRETGFSLNNKELDIGLRSVAAPIRDESKKVIAAVNIAVPSSRITLDELRTKFARKVVEVAKVISEGLGYKTI